MGGWIRRFRFRLGIESVGIESGWLDLGFRFRLGVIGKNFKNYVRINPHNRLAWCCLFQTCSQPIPDFENGV